MPKGKSINANFGVDKMPGRNDGLGLRLGLGESADEDGNGGDGTRIPESAIPPSLGEEMDLLGSGDQKKKPYDINTSRVDEDQIYIKPSMKDQLEEIIAYMIHPGPHGEDKRINGVMFKGLPGTGKTYSAKWLRTRVSDITGQDVKLFVVGSVEKPEDITQIYDDARQAAKDGSMVMVFHDEVDKYGKRKDQIDPTKHAILNQLFIELDGTKSNKGVITVCCTNLEDKLDPAFRRGKRVDREIYFEPLDRAGRQYVAEVEAFRKDDNFSFAKEDLEHVVDNSFGYVGADMSQLFVDASSRAHLLLQRQVEAIAGKIRFEYSKDEVSKLAAELKALPLADITADLDAYAGKLIERGIAERTAALQGNRILENKKLMLEILKFLDPNPIEEESEKAADTAVASEKTPDKKQKIRWIKVSREHFDYALDNRVPSSLKDMPWEETGLKLKDFVGYNGQESLVRQIVKNGLLNPASGKGTVLYFYGEDGCGVTDYARAVAGEYRTNLIVVHGADPEDKFVGVAKDNIHELAERARAAAPCIVVFDEVQYLAQKDGTLYSHKDSQTGALRSILKPTPGVIYILTGKTMADLPEAIRSKVKYTFKFEKPADEDSATRKAIWELYLDNQKVEDSRINVEPTYAIDGVPVKVPVDLDELAKESAGLNGGQIKDICTSMHEMGTPYRQGAFLKLIEQYKAKKDMKDMDDASKMGLLLMIGIMPPGALGQEPPSQGGNPGDN